MQENAASKFKTFWAKQPRCATTPNPGHRPSKIETSVPHSFSGRVHVVTGSPIASPQRTWARSVDGSTRPNTWARPAETAPGFWGTAPNISHPTRKHSGSQMSMLHDKSYMPGYQRCLTPPAGHAKILHRDPGCKLNRSKVSRQLEYVDLVTAINGRPQDYVLPGRRGPVTPEGMLLGNRKAEKKRHSAYTDNEIVFRAQPEICIPNETQLRLEEGPLYSSFGLPGRAHIKLFDPSVGMPKRWKNKLHARMERIWAEERKLSCGKLTDEEPVPTELPDPEDPMRAGGPGDTFSPGVGGWGGRKGSVRRDSIGGLSSPVETPGMYDEKRIPVSPVRRGSTATRGSTESRRASTVSSSREFRDQSHVLIDGEPLSAF